MTDLVYDIETVGPKWDALDEETRAYLTKRQNAKLDDPDAAETEAADRTGLDFGLHEVVAIGVGRMDTGSVHSFRGCEADILSAFWDVVASRSVGRLVTFNGRGLDGPAVMIRSAIIGVPVRRDLVGYRFDWSQHLDLTDALSFYGATRSNYSLDYWCRRFGIDSPKQHGSGADVRSMTDDELARYVEGDVRATMALYYRLGRSGLLSLSRGGPVSSAFTPAPPEDEQTIPF